MASVSNIIVYKEDWAQNLQDRLNEPTKWKEICNVEYTNVKVLNNPYLTDPTVQTGSRGSSYTYQIVSETNESVSTWTFKILPQFIDRADLAQSGYQRQMEMSDRQAILLDEAVETAVMNTGANSLTTFDASDIPGGGSGSIAVVVGNIDDIIVSVVKKIRVAKGDALLARNGGFIVWTPTDFALLTQYAMGTGFSMADKALENGFSSGIFYGGLYHYSSNLLAAGRCFAGVRKVLHLGILRDTYGQVMVDDRDPAQISGIGVVSRVDFAVKAWTNTKTILFDVAVTA